MPVFFPSRRPDRIPFPAPSTTFRVAAEHCRQRLTLLLAIGLYTNGRDVRFRGTARSQSGVYRLRRLFERRGLSGDPPPTAGCRDLRPGPYSANVAYSLQCESRPAWLRAESENPAAFPVTPRFLLGRWTGGSTCSSPRLGRAAGHPASGNVIMVSGRERIRSYCSRLLSAQSRDRAGPTRHRRASLHPRRPT